MAHALRDSNMPEKQPGQRPPVTPPRPPPSTLGDPKSKVDEHHATPYNDKGTSSHVSSDAVPPESSRQQTLADRVLNDLLRHFSITPLHSIIKYWLEKISSQSLSDDRVEQAYEAILHSVLPICQELKQELSTLKAYCSLIEQGSLEARLYEPLVRTCNMALDLLRAHNTHPELQEFGFRQCHELDIIFCRNAEKGIQASYDNYDTTMKPDLLVTSRRSAMRVLTKTQGWESPESIREALYSLATRAPPDRKKPFTWEHTLSAVEVKRLDSTTLQLEGYETVEELEHFPAIPRESLASYPSTVKNLRSGNGKRKVSEEDSEQRSESSKRSRSSRGGSRVTNNATTTKSGTGSIPTSDASLPLPNVSLPIGMLASVLEPQRTTRSDPPPCVQAAMYGASMISRGTATQHAINLLIFGPIAYIWYYDRDGAIQTSGINIIKNLPHFLVLLFIMQRFSLEDWGFTPELSPIAETLHLRDGEGKISEIPFNYDFGSIKVSIQPSEQALHKRFSFVGRGTRVMRATSDSTTAKAPGLEQAVNLVGKSLVVKFAWADSSRLSEADIIQSIADRAEVEEGGCDMLNHLPRVYGSKSFEGRYTTKPIRKALGLLVTRDGIQGHRRLVVLVAEALKPIESLTETTLPSVFFGIVKFHYFVWAKCSIHHRDPSLRNLMYRDEGGKPVGVLNDWDLAHDNLRDSTFTPLERTGTVPFMAVDLLLARRLTRHLTHIYRYDLEALIWVLVWLFIIYRHKKEVKESFYALDLLEWRECDSYRCGVLKNGFLAGELDDTSLPQRIATRDWRQLWPIARALLQYLSEQMLKRKDAKMAGSTEISDDEVYDQFWSAVRGAVGEVDFLRTYVEIELPSTGTTG